MKMPLPCPVVVLAPLAPRTAKLPISLLTLAPSLPTAAPSLRIAAPSLRIAAPSLRIAAPSLRKASLPRASPTRALLAANRQPQCLTGGQAPLGHGTDALKLVLAPPRGGASFLKCVLPEAHGAGKVFCRVSRLRHKASGCKTAGVCFQGQLSKCSSQFSGCCKEPPNG